MWNLPEVELAAEEARLEAEKKKKKPTLADPKKKAPPKKKEEAKPEPKDEPIPPPRGKENGLRGHSGYHTPAKSL